MKQVKVLASDDDGAFGTRASDKIISLGRADVYRLVGVFDSEDTSADATLPSMTVTSTSGTFTRGERITGGTSGAKARLSNAAVHYHMFFKVDLVQQTLPLVKQLQEVIWCNCNSRNSYCGSKVITSNFELDTGQRDNFYDIARIVRKANTCTSG